MDLYSIEEAIIPVRQRKLIRTGLVIKLPPESEAQIRPRSGLAINVGISITNSPGTVDESYRGEVKVIVENRGDAPFKVEKHMRIAQMVICPILRLDVEEGKVLIDTDRGANGFGSTGV
jgi:dUTP pyrophosphatase